MEEVADILSCLEPTVDVALDFVGLDTPRYANLIAVLVSSWRLVLVGVVESEGHGGSGHACISAFVDQVLHFFSSDGRHARNAHDEADGVEDVRLTRAI